MLWYNQVGDPVDLKRRMGRLRGVLSHLYHIADVLLITLLNPDLYEVHVTFNHRVSLSLVLYENFKIVSL